VLCCVLIAANGLSFGVVEAWAEVRRPDYASPEAWLVHGEGQGPAVFYLHPTTYAGDTWNAALDEASARPGLDDILVTHVGVFRDCCAIWAPRYRQAAMMALFDRSGQGEAAYALAYEDVAVAFTGFLSRIGSQPFVLAGHSQGSFHLRRLLEEKVAPLPGIRDRLIAAYVIGIGVPHALFAEGESLYPLAACTEPADVGCVASWSLFTDDVGARNFAQVQAVRYPELIRRTGEARFLCVNPISGRADAIPMPAQEHPGAWMPGAPAPVPGVTGLVCQDGALVAIDTLEGAWMEAAFAGGSLHMLDYHLTFGAMQRDIAARIDAFCVASPCE
jgi:pimeloyl-ACP methyl ester carboxylesterase